MIDRGSSGPWAGAASVDLDDTSSEWPLIRNLLDDPVYSAQYYQELDAARGGAFDEATVVARMRAYHDLIAPYVVGEDGEQAPYSFLSSDAEFEGSLDSTATALEPHLAERHAAIAAAID